MLYDQRMFGRFNLMLAFEAQNLAIWRIWMETFGGQTMLDQTKSLLAEPLMAGDFPAVYSAPKNEGQALSLIQA